MHCNNSITDIKFAIIVDIDVSDGDARKIEQKSGVIIVTIKHYLLQNYLIRDPAFNYQLQIIHIF